MLTGTWDAMAPGNKMSDDFRLYSTERDMDADVQPWRHCPATAVVGRGFPNTCGPKGDVQNRWLSVDKQLCHSARNFTLYAKAEARPALPRSWDVFKLPPKLTSIHCAC